MGECCERASQPEWPSALLLWLVTAVVGGLIVFAATQNNILITCGVLSVVAAYSVFGFGWVIWAAPQSTGRQHD